MRTLVVIAILFPFLATGCGGDEMTSGTPDTSGSAATQPDTSGTATPEKKAHRLSPEAVTVMGDYKMVRNLQDYETKKKRALEKAKQHAMTPPDAQLYVGELYRLAEDDEDAAKAYEKFVMGCPDSKNLATGRYYAGLCFAKAGNLDKAEKYLAELKANHAGEVKMIRSLGLKIGRAHLEKGSPEKAIPYLQAATDSGDSYAAEELMSAQWIAGDYDGARKTADKLVAMVEGKENATKRAKIFRARAELMGKPAKPIEVFGTSMDDFTVDSLKGKVHLVYFWKMPMRGNALRTTRMISKLYDELGEKGLMVLGLNKPYGYDPREHTKGSGRNLSLETEVEALKVWAVQKDLGYNVRWPLGLTKDESLQKPYGFYPSQAIPAMALVDKKGVLRYFRQGFDETGIELLKVAIRKCLAE